MAHEFDLEEAVAVLERTPRTLDALLRDLPEPWTVVDEGPDTRSPRGTSWATCSLVNARTG